MAHTIDWSDPLNRLYHYGVDRVAVYPRNGEPGVPWMGITSIADNANAGTVTPFYLDGIKYYHNVVDTDLLLTVNGYTPPPMDGFEGSVALLPGLTLSGQRRRPFDLTYRTSVGNAITDNLGHQINLVYNATAIRGDRTSNTRGADTNHTTFTWGVHPVPEFVVGGKPTAHATIDSRTTPTDIFQEIESILYGFVGNPGRMPSLNEIRDIFAN